VKKFLSIILLLFVVGCQPVKVEPPGKPTIDVRISEDSNGAKYISISFNNHLQVTRTNDKTNYFVQLDLYGAEEIDGYEKQVKFLLCKLKEAKEKMSTMKSNSNQEKTK
jgi:hypothetical protein